MKLRQPKLVDLREQMTERLSNHVPTDGSKRETQKVPKIYAHLMFGDELVRVCISRRAADWARKKDSSPPTSKPTRRTP